jgi:hypothetical protein
MASAVGGACRGCKLSYESGERDINKSRCQMKLCCFRDRQLETCIECDKYSSCDIIQSFYSKKGYKYQKYRQSLEFIRDNGYDRFIEIADTWKGPYGRLDR